MSRVVKESFDIRSGSEPEVAEIEVRKSTPAESQDPATHTKTFSLKRRLIADVVACQLLLAIGLVLAALLYAKTESAILAGSVGILFLIVSISFAVRTVRRGLEPLRELAERAREISAPNWNLRELSTGKQAQELSTLANSIEIILGRLKTSFRQQRDFTNDAAHEWKTSVAIVKSSLQSLLRRPRTQREYQIGLEELLEDCSRLEDLLEKMLRLARIEQVFENNAPRNLDPTNVSVTCEAALSRIRKMAEERNVSLELEVPDSIFVRADPDDPRGRTAAVILRVIGDV